MVLTGPEDEEDGAEQDKVVCTGCFDEDTDDAELEFAADEEKHLDRNDDVLADVEALLELSQRLRTRPATLLRQKVHADIVVNMGYAVYYCRTNLVSFALIPENSTRCRRDCRMLSMMVLRRCC